MTLPNPFPMKSTDQSAALKTGSNGALVVVVLDESGSMASVTGDTIKGLNSFIDKQKAEPGPTWFTLCKFSYRTNFVYKNLLGDQVRHINTETYQPGGGTALNDAFGDAIAATDAHMKSLPENERPHVVFVVLTDGEENASSRFTNSQIKALVEERRGYGWAFTFLGANIDAFAAGSSYGIGAGSIATYGQAHTVDTFNAVGAYTSTSRSFAAKGLFASAGNMAYTDEQRDTMVTGSSTTDVQVDVGIKLKKAPKRVHNGRKLKK